MKLQRIMSSAFLAVVVCGTLHAQDVFRYTNDGLWLYTGSNKDYKPAANVSQKVPRETDFHRSSKTKRETELNSPQRNVSNVNSYQRDLIIKVHTNMIYDAALAPNGGLELSFCKDWTVGTDGWIAWMRDASHNAWYEHYGFDVFGRYWFGKAHTRPFTGYHVGPYAGTLTYDLYPEGKGYQCDKMFKTFRVGAEFGYAVSVKNFVFDFFAGIGFLHTRQDVYYPNHFNNGYYKAYRRYRNLPDFTRFGITIGYVFGK